MEAYVDNTSLWDLSHASNFSQLADDDFLALLQKQFPTNNGNNYATSSTDGINPQNITQYPLPNGTPSSEDSSPSPSNSNNDTTGAEDPGDLALKRKAGDEDLEEGPSQKAQHTSSSGKKLTSGTRRKSTGTTGPVKDESRLLKRKEQNRAAQRAFRERKERHVKDLEDMVAALEAKNEQAMHENENLRDLLSRLQSENVALKQSSFTFAVPKTAVNAPPNAQVTSSFPQLPMFSSSSPPTSIPSSASSISQPKFTNPLEWSSLTTFDPAMLNLLDESSQQTATDGAMQMDFGFGGNTGLAANTPYTTIASNPMFMSFASTFDSATPLTNINESSNSSNFDMNPLSSWSTSNSQDGISLEDLLTGYMARTTENNLYAGSSSASVSPVAHHTNLSTTNLSSQSPSLSSSSSPSSTTSDPLFDTVRESTGSESDLGHDDHNETKCPKTKGELVKKIESSKLSPFAPENRLRKSADQSLGQMVECNGTKFPSTNKSDQNIEVLSAWRSITSNPRFKDVDITELCTEFTNKARCDGTKVVLEPQGVTYILDSLASLKK